VEAKVKALHCVQQAIQSQAGMIETIENVYVHYEPVVNVSQIAGKKNFVVKIEYSQARKHTCVF
jgi:hypothetical protein